MQSLAILMLVVQVAYADPLSSGMQQLCRSKPACMAKQRNGVREFLDSIVIYRPSQAAIQGCLGAAARKRLTDWNKAASCLEAWGRKNSRSRRAAR